MSDNGESHSDYSYKGDKKVTHLDQARMRQDVLSDQREAKASPVSGRP